MRRLRSHDQRCERARQGVSLRLDGELSEFESVLLATHLARCDECRAFEEEATALTAAVRLSPLEPLRRPMTLPRRRRAVLANVPVAAAAAVALVAVGVATLVGSLRAGQGTAPVSEATSAPAFLQSADYELRLAKLAQARKSTPRAI